MFKRCALSNSQRRNLALRRIFQALSSGFSKLQFYRWIWCYLDTGKLWFGRFCPINNSISGFDPGCFRRAILLCDQLAPLPRHLSKPAAAWCHRLEDAHRVPGVILCAERCATCRMKPAIAYWTTSQQPLTTAQCLTAQWLCERAPSQTRWTALRVVRRPTLSAQEHPVPMIQKTKPLQGLFLLHHRAIHCSLCCWQLSCRFSSLARYSGTINVKRGTWANNLQVCRFCWIFVEFGFFLLPCSLLERPSYPLLYKVF